MGSGEQRNSFRRNLLAWLLSAVSVLVTFGAVVYSKQDADADAQRDFEYACDEIRFRIDARMKAHAQILRGGAAVFQASDEVTRDEWNIYTMHQKVDQNLPGIQGIGFAKLIRPDELAAHIQAVRAEGFPDYKVIPEGQRPIYTSIVFLESFSERNRRAFGYDMFTEPVRRKAMEKARDDDVAALSGRVTLLQETDTDIQAGTLMYVPVYRMNVPLDSVARRREALRGWVYSPYRMKDLMNGILYNRDTAYRPDIRLQVYDQANRTKESLMYDSAPLHSNAAKDASKLTLDSHMTFNGHPWYLRFSRPNLHPEYPRLLSVALSGAVISLLLFGMVSSLLTTRRKAQQLADQLKVEARLEAVNQQLQKNESLHRMAGAIAHHFNNKLGAVMGNLELALYDLPADATVRPMLRAAMVAASGAAEISSKMLTYLGHSTGEYTPKDLSQIVRGSLPLLQTVAPKGVDLKVDLPAAGPTVNVDRNQIQQILTNLTANAFEAVDAHKGRVIISVKEVSGRDLPLDNRFPVDWQPAPRPYASLEVADTGGGIAKSDFNKLFDPFFSSRFTGRGLGLPAVLGIARAHGGAVALESEQNTGSTFRVFLPICEKPLSEEFTPLPTAAAMKVPSDNAPGEAEGTVLLVEDEPPLREMAAIMLSRLGYLVLCAADGEEAISLFRQHQAEIRVVLCDLSMPRKDGFETMEALRKIRPEIPVVLTSGHLETHAMVGEQKEQPQGFLHKPYQRADLKAALEQAIRIGAISPPP